MGNHGSSFEVLVIGHVSGLFDIALSLKMKDSALQQKASAALDQNVKDWISGINRALPGIGSLIGGSIRASVQHEISIAFAILQCNCKDATNCRCENAQLMQNSLSAMQTTQEDIVKGLTKFVGKESQWRTLLTKQLLGIINYLNALAKNSADANEVQLQCYQQGKELSDALATAIG